MCVDKPFRKGQINYVICIEVYAYIEQSHTSHMYTYMYTYTYVHMKVHCRLGLIDTTHGHICIRIRIPVHIHVHRDIVI